MSNEMREKTTSVWSDTKMMSKFSSLDHDLEVDVCIVGGGMAGLTAAYTLMNEGKKVCLLEAFELASGQSGQTSAHVSNVLGDRFFELEKYHGKEGVRLAVQSHRHAINRISEIIDVENIHCDDRIVDGYLFAQNDPRQDVLIREIAAAQRAGLLGVKRVDSGPLHSFATGPCLKFTGQLEFHPLKYLNGLARCIADGGGLIFTNTHVKDIEDGDRPFVKTDQGYKVTCRSVVVATNAPINDRLLIHTKQAPYRTYAIGLEIPKGSVQHNLYWDTLDPYHYIRVQAENEQDILIVGGEDHRTGQEDNTASRFTKLADWAREKFPFAGEIKYKWSGQIMESVDGLAFLGRNPGHDNIYVITGDSGNGLTNATIGAILITDLIMGRENEWEALYSPSRTTFRAYSRYIRENANVAAQYERWLEERPTPILNELSIGEGVVYRSGLQMIAAYKNEAGSVEMMSAACPHLGGVVTWNDVEKSWDCTCHGARFNCHGQVIEGPAVSNLERFDSKDELPQEKNRMLEEYINLQVE